MYNNNSKKYINNYRNSNVNGSANTAVPLPSSLTFANRSAAMITPSKVKQKLTLSAVTGKIVVYSAEDGSTRIGQWGGTECFLSIQPNLGPCLVVRSSRHKRHEGTFFQLHFLQQLFTSHVNEGKLTIVIRHQRQLCSVFIETLNDVNELRIMAATLQDRRSWSMIERNVACKQTKNGSYAISSSGSTNTNTNNDNNSGSNSNTYASGRLRDPMLAPLQNEDYDSNNDDDDDNDSYDESEREDNSRKEENNNLENFATITAQPEETVIEDNNNNNTSVNTNTSNAHINSHQANLLKQELLEHELFTVSEDLRKAIHYVKNGENVFITLPASNRSNTNNNLHGMETWFASLFTLLERKMHKHVLVTSPLASASHKCNRLNIYSLLCIRPHKTQYKLDRVLHKIKKDVDKWQLWQHCDVCIVEEVHLLPTNVFTLLCQVASSIRKTITGSKEHEPVQWIVLGDFLQLPPYSFVINTINNKNSSANNKLNKREEEENVTGNYAFLSEEWEKCKFMNIHLECDSSNKNTLAQCAEDVRRGKWSNTVEQTWRTVWTSLTDKEEDNQGNTFVCIGEQNTNTENGVLSKVGKFEIVPVEIFISREEANRYNLQHLSSIRTVISSNNNNLSRLYHYESDDYASIPGTNIDENVVLLPHLSLKVGAQVILLSNDSFLITPQSCIRNNNMMTSSTTTTTYCQVERGEVGLIADFTCVSNNKFITPHNVNNYNTNNNNKRNDEEEEEEVLPIVCFPRKKVSVVIHRLLIEVRCSIENSTADNNNDDDDNYRNTITNGAWNNKHLFMSRRQLPLSLCWALSVYDAQGMILPRLHIPLSLVNDVHNKEILCVRKEPMVCGFLYVIFSCVLRASDIHMTFTNNTGINNVDNTNINNILDELRSFVTHRSASHMALKYYATHFPRRYECAPSIEHINLMEENIVKNDEHKRKRARSLSKNNNDENYQDSKLNDSNNTVQEEYALHEIAVNMPISNTIPSFTQDSQLYEFNNTQSTLIKGLLLDDE